MEPELCQIMDRNSSLHTHERDGVVAIRNDEGVKGFNPPHVTVLSRVETAKGQLPPISSMAFPGW